jgi:hypothetical protein
MTELEYQRWKQFSLRMAWRGFPRVPRRSKVYLTNIIKDFFRRLDDEMSCDESLFERLKSWDHTDDHPTRKDYYERTETGPYICDIVSEWIGN